MVFLKSFFLLIPLIIFGSDGINSSKPIEMPVEFRNISKNFAFVISYKELLHPLGVRTDETICCKKFPILFALDKAQEVPLFGIAMFEAKGNQIGSLIKILYAVPRISIIKVANPPDKEFVPRYLPIIYIEDYANSAFPIQFKFEMENRAMNYLISFSE